MKHTFKKLWPHLAVIIGLALFCIFYFLPENAENKTLPQGDVQHSLSMQTEIRKFQESEDREILWTNSMFSGMPSYQIIGGHGNTFNQLGTFLYTSFLMGKGITSPTGLLFACCLGFYIMMLCFRFDWKYAMAGAILFGMSTSMMHLINAGHVNKVLVLALLPPTLGGIWLLYQKKYLLGAAITTLFVNLQIMANHPQISFYFAFLIGFFVIGAGIHMIRRRELKSFLIATGLLLLCGGIGIMPNLPKLLTTQEYSEETMRGKRLLLKDGQEQDGLEKDYAFGWSMSIPETMTHFIPNFLGGSSQSALIADPGSQTLRVLQSMPPEQANQLAQATTSYFGQQAFTSGAWYWGISVITLFFLAFFSTKHWLRWWGLASVILLIMLSWGDHFKMLNYFLFDHFPLFNKFRAVSMAINLAHMVLLVVGLYGLREFFKLEKQAQFKALKLALIPAAVIVLIGFAKAWGGNLVGPNDAQLTNFPDLLSAMKHDRSALVQKDTFRSLGFILAMAALLYIFIKSQFNKSIAFIGLILLVFIDLLGIDKRYLPNTNFQSKSTVAAQDQPRPVDKEIMQDPALSYRVADFTTNPFSDAFASNFHKNIGGYHAAKLSIYQDIIDRYLSNPQEYLHVYALLNNKYVIAGDRSNPAVNLNPRAKGNAWFAREVITVNTPEEEIVALGDTANFDKAVINKEFAAKLQTSSFQFDPEASIALTKYVPDRMTYEYSAASPQFAVFSEVYYPESKGWHVYIDGQRVTNLARTNYILRGIEVPAGKHTLEMKFEPRSYYLGQNLGRIGSIVIILLLLSTLYVEVIRSNKSDEKT